MYKKIVWATDGSQGADVALAEARRLARVNSGRIIAVHCDPRLSGRGAGYPLFADEGEVRSKIRHQIAQLRQMGVDIELLVRRTHEEAADVVAALAEELDADVIVCGTGGRATLAGALLGSFAHRLVHVARCPVLTVPRVALSAQGERERGRRQVRA